MIGSCQACGKWAELDRCHIQTKKTGGSMDEFNIVLMCRESHQLQHSLGWSRFIGKHKMIYPILRSKGWALKDVLGVTKLVRYAKD